MNTNKKSNTIYLPQMSVPDFHLQSSNFDTTQQHKYDLWYYYCDPQLHKFILPNAPQ